MDRRDAETRRRGAADPRSQALDRSVFVGVAAAQRHGVANRPQLDVVRRRGGESRTVLGAATTLALTRLWRCRACVTAELAELAGGAAAAVHFRPTRPWPAVVVTRRHESSTAPTGGAAQLVVPQRARACAAVLCFLAVRSCKAPPHFVVGSGRSPFTKHYPHIVSSGGRPISWALTLGHACVADR